MISGLQLRYRPHLPLVLKGVTLDIRPGEFVCVIGRTGAGKSSLVAAITRLVEPAGGSIAIDGVDVSGLPLRTLRSGMTVVSQDPLFFSGSLRRNLDPFHEHGDDELIDALKRVRLYEFARSQVRAAADATAASSKGAPTSSTPADPAAATTTTATTKAEPIASSSSRSPLDMAVSERGGNLSAGQQQLLALARALLQKPRILLLDEASANLDVETEALVNDTILASFGGATILQIAHRLIGCVRADRVIVMVEGRVGEVGHPWQLLTGAEGNGLFAGLASAMPPAQRARLEALARAAWEAKQGLPRAQ